ncbi:hypothetical protein LV84_04067 [Algoriphagus ratkowskyi]|uniref:O-antigen/teichoic acid export membrane protein n=1 Tax=Algoriphagus ratkowskyi TaxID=57028 RepID=A0A2W7R2X9_9BACT|nr:hypothetical protein [Algoriphagus ratkowskyi]PZX50267.1 hypothetical protein LV84_04067 [Algoriphagus ratkowskyi]TXD75619.1 hypothetical protein ESW18_19775 [Algoriphagus ratkowskyi]
MGLKKDFVYVGGSNFLVFSASLINGLILPSYLSYEEFSDLKTYTLFLSFVGLLHFGFVDGINVIYGGLTAKDVNPSIFKEQHDFFILSTILISVIAITCSVYFGDMMFILLALSIFPLNMQSFFLSFYQAIGEFSIYFKCTIITPIINICFTCSLLLLNITDYYWYVLGNLLGTILSFVFLELNNSIFKERIINISIFKNILKYRDIIISGIFILFGNILFTMYFDVGKWTTKLFLSNIDFAIYSLSVSLVGFVLIFVSSVNKIFYPYLFKNQDSNSISQIRVILLLVSAFSIPFYFILDFIVLLYLPNYVDSLPITAILITTIPGVVVIKSIYVNLYKIKKIEPKFLFDSIVYLIIAISLSVVSFLIFESLNSIAISFSISIGIWLLLPLSLIKFNFKEFSKELLYFILFFYTFYELYYTNYYFLIKFLVFICIVLLLNLVFFRKQFLQIFIFFKL